jgi:GDPmannose 4,6-dehydratase
MESNNKIAFITGINGQDGAYLAHLLLEKNYTVYGSFRRGSSNKMWRLEFLKINHKVNLIEMHLNEPQQIINIFKEINPTEIYHLAGESFVADSFNYPVYTIDVNVTSVINILNAVNISCPNSKLFFASSSEVFGYSNNNGLNERSKKIPSNPYGISKLTADNFIRLYRDKYNIFACSGILFNHESPLRSRSFVTRKITYNMAQLKVNNKQYFEIGNFDSARDWGSAYDYVKAMYLMLQTENPNDLVISTGKLTTLREVMSISALYAGFDPVFEGTNDNEICVDKTSGRKLVAISSKYYRPFDTNPMFGNSSAIQKVTGWSPQYNITDIIELMTKCDLERVMKGIENV